MKVVSSVGSNTGALIEIRDNSNNGDAGFTIGRRGRIYREQGFHFAAVKDMLARFRPDEFTLAMAATVTIALVVPCYGAGARFFEP